MGHSEYLKQHTTMRMGTFNLRCLNDQNKQKCLWKDMEKYKVDLCCLQKTKMTEEVDTDVNKCRFINIGSECRHYGNGFAVSSRWRNNIVKYWKVSDRICVIQLRLQDENFTCQCTSESNGIKRLKIRRNERNMLSVINVYASTTGRADANPNERTEFYTAQSRK